MISIPYSPRAIIEFSKESFDAKTKQKKSEPVVTYDSWSSVGLFKSVDVQLTTDMTSKAEWKVFDPKFILINFFTQKSDVKSYVVRVFLGFGQELGEPVFKGILVSVRRNQEDTVFTFYDMGFRMKQIKRAGYFNKKDDLAILKFLAGRSNLSFNPPDNPLKLEPHNAIIQSNQTDWEHAVERAEDSGLVLFVREDTLFARYPAKLAKPKLILKNRIDCLLTDFDFDFRTPENDNVRPRIVETRGRGKAGKRLTGKSDESGAGRKQLVFVSGCSSGRYV